MLENIMWWVRKTALRKWDEESIMACVVGYARGLAFREVEKLYDEDEAVSALNRAVMRKRGESLVWQVLSIETGGINQTLPDA